MIGRRAATLALALAAPAWAGPAKSARPPLPALQLEPPPGWRDVSAEVPAKKGILLALRGPEQASFALAEMPAIPLDNPASVRSYLWSVLDGVRAGSKRDFRSSGRLQSKTFKNGLSAQLLFAELNGKPRLILAVIDVNGRPVLGTLASAAPEAMMGALFGELRVGGASATMDTGAARSSDGQLEIALGGGLRSRAPTAEERRQGVVLVVKDDVSEALFLRLPENDAAPAEQAGIVRATAANALRVKTEDISDAKRARTPAGPSAVYAWGRVPGSPELRFAAGYLPWQFWGYSVLARGAQADEFLTGVLAALRRGPAAVPGLVDATPEPPIPGERTRLLLLCAGLALALGLGVYAWTRPEKNSTVSP